MTDTPEHVWVRLEGRTDTHTVRVSFTVEGHPPMNRGRAYSEDRKYIYIESVDMAFVNGRLDSVVAYGRRKLKSGAMGNEKISVRVWSPESEAPEWLKPYLNLATIDQMSQLLPSGE